MIIRAGLGIGVLFVAWVALLAAVMSLSRSAPAALVPAALPGFAAALPANISVIEQTALGTVLASDNTDLVRQLYRAGAIVVLPAGLAGCAPLG
ncbi:hypothetical protein So717_07490 [Roseobacter cerasinus]|uniref:Uncharacterized protein n=1 Tax=Roseobacter cerasinus TaxID=2602289 RepID=A0A640VS10_9RHOB|nr:hypothetical protein [Roseobacter cerasinus]GFE48996.1 hypothetical protein So717_07490 [Roseobacter cerasinus]